jgi:hypothetical protein
MLRPALYKGDRVRINRRYLNSVAARLKVSPSDLKKCTFMVQRVSYSRLECKKLHYPGKNSFEGFADVLISCELGMSRKLGFTGVSVKRRELWKIPKSQKKSSSQVELERHMQEAYNRLMDSQAIMRHVQV